MHPIAAPPLHGPSDTLARAARARPRPFLLAVPGASARGIETRFVDAVERGGLLVLTSLGLKGAACGNVLLAPAQARRELAGPFGSAMEVLLVTPDGLVAQWSASADLLLEAAVPGSSWEVTGRRLTVKGADGVRILELEPEHPWSVVERRGAVGAHAAMPANAGPIRLLATAGGNLADAEAALARLGRAREAQADGQASALRTRRLATRTEVDELDDGLAWAAARVDAALDPAAAHVHALAAGEPFPFDPSSRIAWTALGALASGGEPHRPDSRSTSPTELEVLVLARTAAWRAARVAVPTNLPAPAADPVRGAARRGALLSLADAIEPWEGKARAQSLREAAAMRRGPIQLPTLGGGNPDPLASALDLPGRTPSPRALDDDAPPGVRRALAAWACLNDGALERGFALFRQHLSDGFAQGAGLWPDGGRIHDPAAAALVPLVFLDGMLGARADAHYGRLRLAPRLPAHWSKLSVGGITLGTAGVRLDYEADAGRHTFRIAQESGRVPLMLVFEPMVPVSVDAAVRIDGVDATVDVVPVAGRAQLRVQLPLDRDREISIG